MQDLHEQRPSLRSCRHFKDIAAIAGNRRIERGRSSKHYTGKRRVGMIFQDPDMLKNILLLWTSPTIIDMLHAYHPTSETGSLDSVEIRYTVTEIFARE